MLRRNGQRLCKFAACLVALAIVFHTFRKCDDFVPVLFRKLDGFTDQFNKLLPQLNTMLKASLNYTTLALSQDGNNYDLKSEDGSILREKDEKPAQIASERDTYVKIQRPSKDNSQNRQNLKDSENYLSRQSDFIKEFSKFTERQSVEAERRQSLFENVLKNLTRILVEVHQKRQEDSLGVVSHKNQRKQREKSIVIARKKATNYVGENAESLKRRTFIGPAPTEQPETTPKEDLTFRIEKGIIKRIQSTTRKYVAVKTPVLSTGNQNPNTSVSKFTEISRPRNDLPEKMPRKELAIRNEKEQASTINTTTRKHIVLIKTPAPSIVIKKPNNKIVDKPTEILSRANLVEPHATSTLKINQQTTKTENLVPLREKNIISKHSKNALTSKANLASIKANRTKTKTWTKLPTLKPAKRSMLMDQSTLNRRAEVFLRKMKNFGITYNESVFYYKGQPNPGIFYREVLPVTGVKNKLTIFLLHDFHYDSKIWLSIGTLYYLAMHGYRVIALDLPGYGKSKNVSELPDSIEKLKFLVSFMLAVSPKSPRVIVSPGESGLYSVPMVMTASVMLKGVVFISTAYTGKYPASRYENVRLPAFVIYGQNDNTSFLREFLESLNHLPDSGRFHPIQNAGRDCYAEQPDVFHQLLTDFLLKVLQRSKTRKNARAQKQR